MAVPVRDTLLPITRRGTQSRIAIYALLTGVYALIPIWKDRSAFEDFADLPAQFHAALTLVLGWLLVFRTNTAYSRWWEARTLWGSLVNASRNLATKTNHLVQVSDDIHCEIKRHLIAYPFALKNHLRADMPAGPIPGLDDDSRDAEHTPSHIVSKLYDQLGLARREGQIDGDDLRVLDRELCRLLDICGGCERIYKTRIAQSYRVFARQCVFLFLVTLPWGISNDFGWWTLPLTVITAYFMLGLETVAEHVEEPFGLDEDDLDLDGLCATIQTSVEQSMASSAVPSDG